MDVHVVLCVQVGVTTMWCHFRRWWHQVVTNMRSHIFQRVLTWSHACPRLYRSVRLPCGATSGGGGIGPSQISEPPRGGAGLGCGRSTSQGPPSDLSTLNPDLPPQMLNPQTASSTCTCWGCFRAHLRFEDHIHATRFDFSKVLAACALQHE